jgi:hypothetical protein
MTECIIFIRSYPTYNFLATKKARRSKNMMKWRWNKVKKKEAKKIWVEKRNEKKQKKSFITLKNTEVFLLTIAIKMLLIHPDIFSLPCIHIACYNIVCVSSVWMMNKQTAVFYSLLVHAFRGSRYRYFKECQHQFCVALDYFSKNHFWWLL